jgi:hypothetical protein
MAKTSTRKLKVFQTRIGFYDIVIATPSRAAALRGFGVSQDLFAQGLAEEATEPGIVAQALAEPGTPLRRPAGSDGPFRADPARPKLKDLVLDGDDDEPAPGPAKPKKPNKPKKKAAPAPEPAPEPPPRTRPRPVPDRRKLAAAEAELAAAERAEEEGRAGLRRETEALDAERARLRAKRDELEAEELRLRTKRAAAEAESEAKERDWRQKRQKAGQAVERERRAYRLAGGEE